jgi:hypothetical protein
LRGTPHACDVQARSTKRKTGKQTYWGGCLHPMTKGRGASRWQIGDFWSAAEGRLALRNKIAANLFWSTDPAEKGPRKFLVRFRD